MIPRDGGHIMLFHWKNQYCENDYTIQSNLQIQQQRKSIKLPIGIFHRIRRKKNLQFVW